MQTELFADGHSVELNSFLEQLMGNVAIAIVRSLHANSPSSELEFLLESKYIKLSCDGHTVFLNSFVTEVLSDLFRGIFGHLKGTEEVQRYRLSVRELE